MRVAIYTRISTDEEHQPYSLEAQDTRLGAYIASQDGWELTRRYSDRMTGSVLERPELQRALGDARLHRFDLLLVYRVDRLSRSVRGLAQILEELDHAHVLFRSATEPFDTGTPAGRMMVQMLGVFAEFERATMVDRVIAGMERKAARGGWLGGPNPYGYRYNPATSMLEPDEAEAATVRTIFDLYVTKRLGTKAVACGAWSPHSASCAIPCISAALGSAESRTRGLTPPWSTWRLSRRRNALSPPAPRPHGNVGATRVNIC